jgi:WD40 repeat protein
VTVYDPAARRQRRVSFPGGYEGIGFPSGSSLTVVSAGSQWLRMSLGSFRVTASGGSLPPAANYTPAVSPGGSYAGYVNFGQVGEAPTGRGNGGGSGSVPDRPASALAFRPDGRYAAVAESGTVYVTPLVPAASKQPFGPAKALTGNSDTPELAFLGNGTRLVSAVGNGIALWDRSQLSRLSQPTGVRIPFASDVGPPPALLSSPDGSWLSVVGGNATGAWLYRSWRAPAVTAASGAEWDVPVRNRNEPLLVGTARGLVLGDPAGRVLRLWSGGACGTPAAAAVLPGGSQLAAVGNDGSICLYSMSSPAVRTVVRAAGGSVSPAGAAISPDGASAAMSLAGRDNGPGRVVWVDLRTGASHPVGGGDAISVLFTARNLLVQRADGILEVWDARGRTLLRTVQGTGMPAQPMAASPDGTLVARLRDDGTASITDLASGDVLVTFALPSPGNNSSAGDPWDATAMIFTSDGRYLLTATSGGALTRWTMDPSDLVRTACATAGGGLTAAQWRQYADTDPPPHLPCAS